MNTDVRYKGRTLHIQTEDSGPVNPVIITHIFVGGTILATSRLDYDAGREELDAFVRAAMREQHRAMYKALMDGEHDEAIHRPIKGPGADIPLARDKKTKKSRKPAPLAELGGEPGPSNPLLRAPVAPPPVPRGEERTLDDAPDSVSGEFEALDSVDVILLDDDVPVPAAELQAPVPTPVPSQPVRVMRRVEFPTELVTERQIDDVVLACLAEDTDEP